MSALSVGGRGEVSLGAVIAKAGEGTIHEVDGHPEWVAKVFHPSLTHLDAKVRKVAAMVTVSPSGATQDDGFVVLTWPLDVLSDSSGAVGYVMSRVDTLNAVEIHSISNPSNRMDPLPSAPQWTRGVTWSHLVNIAANLCLAVDVVHHVDAVIGDFQERNVLVTDTTQVTLVDCDSMQFTDDGGHLYPCGVGRPEFTAPELSGVNLRIVARERSSDLFALAVHIHLLLMAGNHPFMRGTWTGPGDQPDALSLAKSGSWAGGPGSALRSHPLAPSVDFLPPDVHRLFVRAFTDGARNPSARPSATEWREALMRMTMSTCPRGVHQIPVEADPCPWCVIDDERTTRKAAKTTPTAPAPRQKIHRAAAPRPSPEAERTASGAVVRRRNHRPLVIGLVVVIAVAAALISWLVVGRTTTTAQTGPPSDIGSANDSNALAAALAPVDEPVVPAPAPPPVPPPTAPNSLNVSTPMTLPACDGTGIVVLGNATAPGSYDSEIQALLDRFPGAEYLRTDEACPSLRQSLNGSPIYAVYRVAGRSQAQVCAAVRAAGGAAYGKWLDTVSDPTKWIEC